MREKNKVQIIVELEIEHDPNSVDLDDVICELEYSFNVWKEHLSPAEIKNSEIIEANVIMKNK